MSRHQPVRWSVSMLAAAAAISGCSMFHHKQNYYDSATESRPLEVPPDLEAPSMSNELVVPTTSGAAAAAPASTVASATAATSATSAPVGTAPPAVVLTGNGLHVADSVDHTWQRVGLALERAQVGTISARDAAGYTYTVDVSGLQATTASTATPAEEHHWYSRILHPFGGDSDKSAATSANAQPVSGHLLVKVSADGDGARVDVEGAAGDSSASEAARRVLEVLRERLS